MNTSSHISALRSKGLLRIFPVPKFLEMPALGLDISKCTLRVVELTLSREGFIPQKCKTFELPEGTLVDGGVENVGALVNVLRDVQKEFRTPFVNVSLPDEKTFVFQTKVPHVAGGNVRESIEFALEENVPIPASEAIFEYKVIGDGVGTDNVHVAVSVIPQSVVESYANVLDQAGLVPLSFQIRSQAITNAVIKQGSTETFLVLHIGHAKTMIFVVERGIVQFSSVIAVGGINLTSAIARTFQVSPEEAHRMKEEKLFVNNTNNGDFFSSLLNTFSVIKDEMHKVSAYWEEHASVSGAPSHGKINKVVLSGGNAVISGLVEYIEEDMRCSVQIADVWTNCVSPDISIPPISFKDSLSYASAVGLALKR
jgi:type IV pilus assembly protein PilM